MYLHPRIDARLLPKLASLRPGTRIVSHDFDIRDRSVRAKPDGRWMLMAPFFGRSNEIFEAGAPEDATHYGQDKHWVYLWVDPLKLEPLPAEPRDELLQATAAYEGYFARELLESELDQGIARPQTSARSSPAASATRTRAKTAPRGTSRRPSANAERRIVLRGT